MVGDIDTYLYMGPAARPTVARGLILMYPFMYWWYQSIGVDVVLPTTLGTDLALLEVIFTAVDGDLAWMDGRIDS